MQPDLWLASFTRGRTSSPNSNNVVREWWWTTIYYPIDRRTTLQYSPLPPLHQAESRSKTCPSCRPNLPRRRAGHVRLRPAALPCAPLHLRLLPLIKDAIGGLGVGLPSADRRPARPGERATTVEGWGPEARRWSAAARQANLIGSARGRHLTIELV